MWTQKRFEPRKSWSNPIVQVLSGTSELCVDTNHMLCKAGQIFLIEMLKYFGWPSLDCVGEFLRGFTRVSASSDLMFSTGLLSHVNIGRPQCYLTSPHLTSPGIITELSKPGPIPCWPGWLGKQQLSKVLIISCHEKPSITLMNGILNTRPGEKTSVRSSSSGDKIICYVSIYCIPL